MFSQSSIAKGEAIDKEKRSTGFAYGDGKEQEEKGNTFS